MSKYKMKLSELKAGDRFLWKGEKYQLFYRKISFLSVYRIPVHDWPAHDECLWMRSDTDIKPIVRI